MNTNSQGDSIEDNDQMKAKIEKDGSIIGYIKEKIQDKIFGTLVLAGHRVRSIEGAENIPEGKAIILPWHLSDDNVPDTMHVLHSRLKHRDVSVVTQETNYDELGGAQGKLFNLSGKDRFLPLSNSLVDADKERQGSNSRYEINPEDFQNFARVLDDERKLIIAGHRPTKDGELPKRAGIGGIISAYLTGAPIIPATFSGSRWNQAMKFSPKLELEEITEEEREILKKWVEGKGENVHTLPKDILRKILKDADKIYQLYKTELESQGGSLYGNNED